MPTRIHNPSLSARERYFARQSTYRLASRTKLTEVLRAPWMGWVPDLPPDIVGWRGYRDGRGLISAPYGGKGLFLRCDDGYTQVDPDNLPLGHAGPPDTRGDYAVTMLAQWRNASNLPERMAVVSGEAAVAEIFVARLDPATGAWTEILKNAGAHFTAQNSDREVLFDHCIYPFGASTRAPVLSALTPLIIFCGSDDTGPVGEVLVYPDNSGPPARYDELIYAATPPGAIFKAVSCETFDGRVHFLNTNENAVPRPNRHRWTAIGTADPNEALVGSGYLDFPEFQRQGRKILAMQDKLVLYFEQGVAFQIPTGFYADAYRPQVLSRTRGLLGTQAACAISPHLHFGIFNDGWWTLDSSGRWSELGRLVLEETRGKSHELTKWKESFYDDLDFEQKHRICCIYDKYHKLVRIAYPSRSARSENYIILNYHWPTDTCWKDRYIKPVSAWGEFDIQTVTSYTWTSYGVAFAGVPGQWRSAVGTWDDYNPHFREQTIVHGCNTQEPGADGTGAYVFAHTPEATTYDGRPINYYYKTHMVNRNEDPTNTNAFHRFGLEYVNVGGSSVSVYVGTDEWTYGQVQGIPTNEGALGTQQNGWANFRLQGAELGFTVQGYGPTLIRSFVPEILLYGGDREGQV